MKKKLALVILSAMILAALNFTVVFMDDGIKIKSSEISAWEKPGPYDIYLMDGSGGEVFPGRIRLCPPTWDCEPHETPYNCGGNYTRC